MDTFSTTQDCIDNIVQLVKENRSELSTEYFLSNAQTNESLLQMCEYYVRQKIDKTLLLVNEKKYCPTEEIPTARDFENLIYEPYVELLTQLGIYQGQLEVS